MALVLRVLKWLFVSVAGIVVVALIAGRVYQEISESRDLERYPPPGQMVDVDGHLMHIDCIGEGSPTVILELGVGSASVSWYDIHRRLSEITKTCAYDRPGLGYSEPIDQPKRAAARETPATSSARHEQGARESSSLPDARASRSSALAPSRPRRSTSALRSTSFTSSAMM